MANVMFKKGLLAGLPSTYAEGTFYVTTDERAIYLDVSDSARIRLGDFQEFATLEALKANVNPSTSALYYISGLNVLAKWNGTDYVQINLDTGATSVEVVGSGNAVTAASYDAVTRKLTLTMGETFATAAELSQADEDIRAYVDEKTKGIATDAALGELQEKVTAAEEAIEALESDTHTHANADVLNGITAEKVAAWDAKQAAGDYATKAEAQAMADGKDADIAAAKKAGDDAAAALESYKTLNDAAVKAADDKAVAAQGEIDALEVAVGTVPEGKTVVGMIAEAQTAATYDDTEVRGLISDNADAIAAEKARMDAFMALEDGQTLNDALDSLKEIQDYITNEAADADILVGKVGALEAIVDGIGGEGESATVVAYVTAAIEALKIGDYAKAADLTALAERVTTAEGKITTLEGASHTHANKAELDLIASGDKAKWDAVVADHLVADDKTELEGKITAAQAAAEKVATDANAAMDTRVAALEGINHEAYIAADEANLNAAKAYADQAETDAVNAANAYADGLAGNYDKSGAAATAESNAKAYADSLVLTWGTF